MKKIKMFSIIHEALCKILWSEQLYNLFLIWKTCCINFCIMYEAYLASSNSDGFLKEFKM